MIIGNTCKLRVSRTGSDTLWLNPPDDDDNANPIPMPLSDASDAQTGDELTVFIYADSDANPVATTKMPSVLPGQCASLKVSAVTDMGAFLDWGIEKELFLPFSEQRRPVQEGAKECVLVFVDNSGRLASSSKLDNHLRETNEGFTAWQEVSLLIFQRTDLGFKAVVNNEAIGLLYKDEIFSDIKIGQSVTGYIKRLRNDRLIDVALQPPSQQLKRELTDIVLQYIQEHDGVSFITDKSSPDTIYETFGVSKKNYKRALSALYKQRRISIEADRVLLVTKGQ